MKAIDSPKAMAVVEKPICPICHSTALAPVSVKLKLLSNPEPFAVLRCQSCAASFFDPMPTAAQLANHYSSGHSFYRKNNPKVIGRGIGFAKKFLKHKSSGKFLDIGCASGEFLYGVKLESGWDVFGTDINPDVVAEASSRLGIDIRLGEVQKANFDAKFFDFIHVRDVLEHVTDPVGFLQECRRLIKDDGVLYISVPNGSADLQAKVNAFYSGGEPLVTEAGHIFFFPAPCLNRLFQSQGFEVLKTYSFGFKKGLRSFGLFPGRKRSKQAKVTIPEVSSLKPAMDVAPPQLSPGRPASKYVRRFVIDEFLRFRGTNRFAFDFIYMLRPAP